MYERLVRSVKEPLKKIIGRSTMNAERMATVLKEIEATMDLRPITFVSDDPNEPRTSTPFHFLLGRETIGTIETLNRFNPIFGNDLTRVMKYREELLEKFWIKWSKDYLRELNSRQKWNKRNDSIDTGEIVLLSEDNCPIFYFAINILDRPPIAVDTKLHILSEDLHGSIRRT